MGQSLGVDLRGAHHGRSVPARLETHDLRPIRELSFQRLPPAPLGSQLWCHSLIPGAAAAAVKQRCFNALCSAQANGVRQSRGEGLHLKEAIIEDGAASSPGARPWPCLPSPTGPGRPHSSAATGACEVWTAGRQTLCLSCTARPVCILSPASRLAVRSQQALLARHASS